MVHVRRDPSLLGNSSTKLIHPGPTEVFNLVVFLLGWFSVEWVQPKTVGRFNLYPQVWF